MKISRRDALKLGGLAAVGTAGLSLPLGQSVSGGTPSLLATRNMPKPYAAAFRRVDVQVPYRTEVDEHGPVAYYDNEAKAGSAAIVPGLTTPVLGYDGLVPGKRIDVEQGTRIVLTMHNKLPAAHPDFKTPMHISTHLHGSASLPQYDGYASDVTQVGEKKTYHYPNFQPARTLWYHDHGVHFTSQNAYSGLATQYHLHDATERALLPQGEYDVAITLSDMMFQANGTQLFDDRSHSGLWGDVILANGAPWPVMKVKKRIYRFRFLNASISRSYRPTTVPAAPTYVVATDGWLMPKSQNVTSWRHGSAERYEVLIDFSGFKAGQRVELRNLSNPNNRDFDNTGKIMAFDVVDDPYDTSDPTAKVVPGALNPESDVMALKAADATKVRNIRVEKSDATGEWMLNGQTWEDVVNSKFTAVLGNPGLGDTEIWDIENKSSGWFHPLHIHLIDFKVLSRNGLAPFPYELGPKDVVYIGEGEKVRLLMKFGPNTGKYMVHCHNLVHEDHDMMHQFSVGLKPGDEDYHDPIDAARPVKD